MVDVRFSKFMVKILRHSAKEDGIQITPDGYVDVDDILGLSGARGKTLQDVENIVDRDNKGRFAMRTKDGKRQIRATQGHNVAMKLTDPDLTPILSPNDVRAVLHGTNSAYWPDIKRTGLSRMTRQHIHFAEAESGVQSGFPRDCDIAVEIDLRKAISGGIKFYKSDNGVILTEGNASGVIPKEFFKKAYRLRNREELPF